MNRQATTWLAFAVCLAVALCAMGWTSAKVLELERAQHLAEQQAAVEENVRLALWRMDSALATLIAEENARPHYVYNAFHAAQEAYTRMYGSIQSGDVLIPSPLLTFESPYIAMHFQVGLDGALSSPQAPTGNMRDLAEAKYTTHEKVQAAIARLRQLRSRLEPARLASLLGQPVAVPQMTAVQKSSQSKTIVEYQQRAEQQMANVAAQVASRKAAKSAPMVYDEQPIRPIWLDDDTPVLARRVVAGDRSLIQGCVLDWSATCAWLLGEIDDLFPEAHLARSTPRAGQTNPRVLAALPAALIINQSATAVGAGWSPLRISLVIAWVGVVLAAVAVAVLLRGAIALSERRGAFVSAVTHELRTPLTTFRMYTDMLSRNMVPDQAKRQQYLDTLRREADRLSHLVENVLAYARLERGRNGAAVEIVAVGDLLDRVESRLQDRAAAADMTLELKCDDRIRDKTVRANRGGVEQVLFNLVDNACKYADDAQDRTIHVEARSRGGGVELIVRDHGPGVASDVITRMFQPFSKSAKTAAESAPGVGLGLALSKRYAHAMGGRLTLDMQSSGGDGACFVLFLSAAPGHGS